MKNTKFPGTVNINVDEGLLMMKVLKKDGSSAKQILSFIEGIDDCLTLQKTASILDRFKGKKRYNRSSARDLIYERACKIEI